MGLSLWARRAVLTSHGAHFSARPPWTAGGGKLADRSPAGPCLPQTPELARVGLSFSGSNGAKAAGLVVTSEPAVPGHPAYPP